MMLIDFLGDGSIYIVSPGNFLLPQRYDTTYAVGAFGCFSKVGDQDHTDTTLRLDSSSSHSLCTTNSKGIKRKREDNDVTRGLGKSSPALGLGGPLSFSYSNNKSSTIACTVFSEKETVKELFMDYGLNFDFKLGNGNTTSPVKPAATTLGALETENKLDLELSLSVGPSESAMTSIDPVTAHHQNVLDIPITVCPAAATVDQGSTSSRWKCGNNLLPYLVTAEIGGWCLSSQMIHGNHCPVRLPDLSSTKIQMQKSPVASSSKVAQLCTTNKKLCQFPGCGKGARGASGLCIAHGGGRRCQKSGCQKGAEGRTIFCKSHGGGRRCEHLGCTKSAEGRTSCCIAHGGGRRCSHGGCARAARGRSGLCIRHGGGKRCQKENCKRSAEGQSGLCISHGGGRRCKFAQCTKGAQGSTNLCKAHGGGKRCTRLGCTKGAEGSTLFCKGHGGGKRCAFQGGCSKSVHGGTLFCVAHGGGKRCAMHECTRSARGRTDFCVRHGGGKRCKSEGCGKAAQGSTDFCKAHGGGKRCKWGRPGSNLGAGDGRCDRLVGMEIGLCIEHTALVEDHRVHGGNTMEAVTSQSPISSKPEKINGDCDGNVSLNVQNDPNIDLFPLSEGRVHGGNIMAMISNSGSHSEVTELEHGMSCTVDHKWL
ncbi:unnamed protein product [Musa textilis]